KLKGIEMVFRKLNPEQSLSTILNFLGKHELNPGDLSLILTGRNGDIRDDYQYELTENSIFKNLPKAAFKHLCGEYPTAVSFGMGIAAKAIQSGNIAPEMLYSGIPPQEIKNILI